MAGSGASRLAVLFEELYREVMARRRAVAESTFETGGDPQLGAAQAATVWQGLLTRLEQQALEVQRTSSDFAVEIYREAQYVMAALADEIFARLDRLLHNQDPAYRSLGEVYLSALTLGFQGRYRGRPEAEEALGAYRRRLYRFLAERDPQVFSGRQHLAPGAYGATLNQGRVSRLPHARRIVWVLLAGIAVWVLATWPLWDRLTEQLRPTLDQIRAVP